MKKFNTITQVFLYRFIHINDNVVLYVDFKTYFLTISALKRRNGDYVVNGNRIVNWSGKFKVGDVEVEYKRLSNNIRETIQITGPTKGDISVMVSNLECLFVCLFVCYLLTSQVWILLL